MFKTILVKAGVLLVLPLLLFIGCGDDKTTNAPADTHTYVHVPFPVDSYFDAVRTLTVTVTATDIVTPITATDTTILTTSQSDIQMTIAAGTNRHFDVVALDSTGQQLYRTQKNVTINSGARTDVSLILLPAGSASPTKVKLFRNTLPWLWPSQPESILVSLGFTQGAGVNQYQVFNSSQMGSIVLTPGVDLVILQAMQETTFYKDYLASREFFEDFVQNGGNLFIIYTAYGMGVYSDSLVNMIFPGGVDYIYKEDYLNHPAIIDHPILAGIAYDLRGTSASHGYFDGLLAGTLVLTVDSLSNPTLVIYGYGQGTVVLSGQPIEYWRYYRGTFPPMGELLSRIVRFILGYDPTPEPLPKTGMPHRVESSTTVR